MAKTKLIKGQKAKDKLLKGVNTVADAISLTLGAQSRSVAVSKTDNKGQVYEHVILDDGALVAKAIDLEDEASNIGVRIIREAALKQVDDVGDGTSATIILARAIIREAEKQIATGINPQDVKRQLQEDLKNILEELETYKIQLKTHAEKIAVATISCHSAELGVLIADVFKKMGVEGVITVEESPSLETTVDYQTGMQWDKGYASPYFATDPESMTATLDNCPILVTDKPLNDMQSLIPLLEKLVKSKQMVIAIVAPSYDETVVLPSFITNKMTGKFLPLLVKAPGYGEGQRDMIQDIALLTGATFVSERAGMMFEDLELEDLGKVNKIHATAKNTVISGGDGKKAEIKTTIEHLKTRMEEEASDYEIEKLRERIAKLTSGVAVIKVGGQTEVEMKGRKDAVDDAVSATRWAIREGIVPGGEVIYLTLRNKAKGILKTALKQPFYTLLENAGLDVADYYTKLGGNLGVDVLDGQIKDMIKAGIVDPLAVPKNALKNAVSVAIQIILTGAIISPEIKKE